MLIEAEQGDYGRETPGHAGTQRHQHVHVGAAATQRLVRAVVETPADPEPVSYTHLDVYKRQAQAAMDG